MENHFQIPDHLKKYVVTQDYDRYTPIDHSVWRFILRQLKAYLSKHAHEFYLNGLEETGIQIDYIPSIAEISSKLEKFGWCAVPVSGFIPPAAFMEMQSLSILPIASDIRTLDHLMYTPAPDIVHEAAGHAPFLALKEYSDYLKKYAQVAKKSIISKEDLDQYEAIRILSDIKENPLSTPEQIKKAEEHLTQVNKNISHISEASELSRMNWWTAEYGLIGSVDNPKIFGAGLLSSVGESKWCLNSKVKKIKLTADCVKTGYDITEPQPQLFVTPDFKHLSEVLEDFAQTMSFKKGGQFGLDRAIKAKSVNTIELNTGLQISGQIVSYLMHEASAYDNKSIVSFVKLNGPTQICYQDQELPGHSKKYHSHGFSSPIGLIQKGPKKCLSLWTDEEIKKAGIILKQVVQLEFESGVKVTGLLQQILKKDNQIILMSFENCTVEYRNQILFDPSWGVFDMAVGSSIPSVFGGPADRNAYGEMDDFVAARVPPAVYNNDIKLLHSLYQEIRVLRDSLYVGEVLAPKLSDVLNILDDIFPNEWLLRMEILELHDRYPKHSHLKERVLNSLKAIQSKFPEKKDIISDGFALIEGL